MTPKITKPKDSIGALYAFWPGSDYPYFLCGEITRMHESGMIETKEYGPGSTVRPVLIVPINRGRRIKDVLRALEQDYRKSQSKLKADFMQSLADQLPELAETRRR